MQDKVLMLGKEMLSMSSKGAPPPHDDSLGHGQGGYRWGGRNLYYLIGPERQSKKGRLGQAGIRKREDVKAKVRRARHSMAM